MSVKLNTDHPDASLKKMALMVVYALSLLLFCLPESANSAIYACVTSDGTKIFQDRSCPVEKPAENKTKPKAARPLGIHESWFELPEHAEGRAICDSSGCECEAVERKHEGTLAKAVADALYMDAGWHHYETSHKTWQDTPSTSAKENDRRKQMIEASCNVMISQQLLRDFAVEVAAQLKSISMAAEERGFDVPDPCDQGVEQACYYYDATELYRRMIADARALTIPRDVLTTASDEL